MFRNDGSANRKASFVATAVITAISPTEQALDLTAGDQVACYDDGVGTSSFKLSRYRAARVALSGAIAAGTDVMLKIDPVVGFRNRGRL
jgi:hypothetical protein